MQVLSNEENSHKVIESTTFLRCVYEYKHYQFKTKDTETVQNEGRFLNPQTSVIRLIKLPSYKHSLIFIEKFKRQNLDTRVEPKATKAGGSPNQVTGDMRQARFQNSYRPVSATHFPSLFSHTPLLRMRMSSAVSLPLWLP